MACTCCDVATNVRVEEYQIDVVVYVHCIYEYDSVCVTLHSMLQNAQESKTRSQSDRVDQEFDIKSDAKEKFAKV